MAEVGTTTENHVSVQTTEDDDVMGAARYDPDRRGYRIFVGNLAGATSHDDLATLFSPFGPIVDVWLASNPPGFGFVVFKSATDAEKAVQDKNNTVYMGRVVKVNHARMFKERLAKPAGGGPRDHSASGSSRSRSRSRSSSRPRSRSSRSWSRSSSRLSFFSRIYGTSRTRSKSASRSRSRSRASSSSSFVTLSAAGSSPHSKSRSKSRSRSRQKSRHSRRHRHARRHDERHERGRHHRSRRRRKRRRRRERRRQRHPSLSSSLSDSSEASGEHRQHHSHHHHHSHQQQHHSSASRSPASPSRPQMPSSRRDMSSSRRSRRRGGCRHCRHCKRHSSSSSSDEDDSHHRVTSSSSSRNDVRSASRKERRHRRTWRSSKRSRRDSASSSSSSSSSSASSGASPKKLAGRTDLEAKGKVSTVSASTEDTREQPKDGPKTSTWEALSLSPQTTEPPPASEEAGRDINTTTGELSAAMRADSVPCENSDRSPSRDATTVDNSATKLTTVECESMETNSLRVDKNTDNNPQRVFTDKVNQPTDTESNFPSVSDNDVQKMLPVTSLGRTQIRFSLSRKSSVLSVETPYRIENCERNTNQDVEDSQESEAPKPTSTEECSPCEMSGVSGSVESQRSSLASPLIEDLMDVSENLDDIELPTDQTDKAVKTLGQTTKQSKETAEVVQSSAEKESENALEGDSENTIERRHQGANYSHSHSTKKKQDQECAQDRNSMKTSATRSGEQSKSSNMDATVGHKGEDPANCDHTKDRKSARAKRSASAENTAKTAKGKHLAPHSKNASKTRHDNGSSGKHHTSNTDVRCSYTDPGENLVQKDSSSRNSCERRDAEDIVTHHDRKNSHHPSQSSLSWHDKRRSNHSPSTGRGSAKDSQAGDSNTARSHKKNSDYGSPDVSPRRNDSRTNLHAASSPPSFSKRDESHSRDGKGSRLREKKYSRPRRDRSREDRHRTHHRRHSNHDDMLKSPQSTGQDDAKQTQKAEQSGSHERHKQIELVSSRKSKDGQIKSSSRQSSENAVQTEQRRTRESPECTDDAGHKRGAEDTDQHKVDTSESAGLEKGSGHSRTSTSPRPFKQRESHKLESPKRTNKTEVWGLNESSQQAPDTDVRRKRRSESSRRVEDGDKCRSLVFSVSNERRRKRSLASPGHIDDTCKGKSRALVSPRRSEEFEQRRRHDSSRHTGSADQRKAGTHESHRQKEIVLSTPERRISPRRIHKESFSAGSIDGQSPTSGCRKTSNTDRRQSERGHGINKEHQEDVTSHRDDDEFNRRRHDTGRESGRTRHGSGRQLSPQKDKGHGATRPRRDRELERFSRANTHRRSPSLRRRYRKKSSSGERPSTSDRKVPRVNDDENGSARSGFKADRPRNSQRSPERELTAGSKHSFSECERGQQINGRHDHRHSTERTRKRTRSKDSRSPCRSPERKARRLWRTARNHGEDHTQHGSTSNEEVSTAKRSSPSEHTFSPADCSENNQGSQARKVLLKSGQGDTEGSIIRRVLLPTPKLTLLPAKPGLLSAKFGLLPTPEPETMMTGVSCTVRKSSLIGLSHCDVRSSTSSRVSHGHVNGGLLDVLLPGTPRVRSQDKQNHVDKKY
ncbi:serine/arginine repetitive matrix protein 2-like [Littorina saxatilis]|uniref:serine/arginine repetitive matrix protein 2-like n=1 Tax=Littorina saxatilis TaxID=31220 RepID=UPI0038B5CB27